MTRRRRAGVWLVWAVLVLCCLAVWLAVCLAAAAWLVR